MPKVSRRRLNGRRSLKRRGVSRKKSLSRKVEIKRGGSANQSRRFSDPATCEKRIEELKSAIWRLEMDKKSVQSSESRLVIEAQIDDLKIRIQNLQEGRV